MKPVYALLVLTLLAMVSVQKKTKIFLAGDSTMSVKELRAYPETGWGMPFATFFKDEVVVDNRAKNGRSTRTFIEEGLWQKLIEDVGPGDYVFIQFGHNDESEEKKDRYTTPQQYQDNLGRFVQEARKKGAYPVLLTPVSRRKFRDGQQVETHATYSPLVTTVAKNLKVPFIDLDVKSRELYQKLGEETSKLLFLQLQPGEHPNYPEGKTDNTHFSELGARLVAQLVLKEIRNLNLPLVAFIRTPPPAK